MSDYPVPDWYKKLRNNFISGNFHQFLFDGNIYDKFFWPSDKVDERWGDYGKEGELYSFKEYLIRALLKSHKIICYYSSTAGLTIYRKDKEIIFPPTEQSEKKITLDNEKIIKAVKDIGKELSSRDIPAASAAIEDRIIETLLRLEGFLKTEWHIESSERKEADTEEDKTESKEMPANRLIEAEDKVIKADKRKKEVVLVATIIDNFDRILTDSNAAAERHIIERVQRLGMDTRIKNNISILLAENREFLPRVFHTENTGTMPIRIDFPKHNYRKLFFMRERDNGPEESLLVKYLGSNEDNVSKLVQLTRGFRIADCEIVKNISQKTMSDAKIGRFFFESENPSIEDIEKLVKEEKKDIIQSSSGGMLEPIESSIEFDDIGGLAGIKKYFDGISQALIKKDENPDQVKIIPKGVLLAGPPGTGKTLIAKALASESGISLVKMGDIRSMWVGESEKNMSIVLSLLKSMAPVIVFIDEIDQAIGSRSAGSGDSGVGGRIFGKILEFMGDNDNRGDVIWIAATNRTDLLDDAMIRRFDRIIPVLLPGSTTEWISVVEGIARQMEIDVVGGIIGKFVKGNIDELRRNHSGSSIEMVLRFAYQKVIEGTETISLDHLNEAFKSFKTNFNQRVYEFQTLLAISACNEIDFIPKPSEKKEKKEEPEPSEKEYSYGNDDLDDDIILTIESRSNTPIEGRLNALRRELSLGY